MNILNPAFEARFGILLYRLRFLGLYTIFGFTSIIIEFLVRSYLNKVFKFDIIYSTIIALLIGIIFAFWSNVNFNFKIHKSNRNRALVYFLVISVLSACIQISLKNSVPSLDFGYEYNRLVISGFVFLVAYTLHRKFTFRDFKKVGVAIYANGVENLTKIYSLIGQYPDFIHVDIIDKTMTDNAETVKTYKLETMKAYWPNTQIQTHIMSYKPEQWLDHVIPYSDVIYVHAECKNNIEKYINKIKDEGKKAGIALTMETNPESIIHLIKIVDYVLLLTIHKPGSSGQKFEVDGFERIKTINSLSFRNNFVLCVDGGVNENIVGMLDAENIVSGSSVLKSLKPKSKIMRLQTASRYQTE